MKPFDIVNVPLTENTFTVAEGRSSGLTRHQLLHPRFHRPFHGLRSLSAGDGLFERCRHFSRAMRPNEGFSHQTAAILWGIPLPVGYRAQEHPLHVRSVATGRERRGAGVIGHRTGDASVFLVTLDRFRTIDPISVWLTLSGSLPLYDLVAAADYLIQCPEFVDARDPRPYCSIEQLTERVRGFRGHGKRRATEALALARVGSDSPMESLLRLRITEFGLPEPELNQVVFTAAGHRIGRVDLIYRRWRVIVEYDGDQHRTDKAQYEKDIYRAEALAEASWNLLRVRSNHILANFAPTAARLRRVLESGGWTPSSVRRKVR
ncbi:endonuclease domain-containing protein [Lysinibacter cavernae]|uniref:DUF559 domain-containing protein n=1 Tax=Lysinibacter cavernae TaxID=1640652 RepID=A0A7X5TUR5_9MICO|nr:DUF559 domain-containing protein [Lysinibacter cavernae]NIH54834.1 hypothetical protein [Lysinibacter cavernae]